MRKRGINDSPCRPSIASLRNAATSRTRFEVAYYCRLQPESLIWFQPYKFTTITHSPVGRCVNVTAYRWKTPNWERREARAWRDNAVTSDPSPGPKARLSQRESGVPQFVLNSPSTTPSTEFVSNSATSKLGRRVFSFITAFIFLIIGVICATHANTMWAQDADNTESAEKELWTLPAWVELGSYQEGDVMYVLVKTTGGQSFEKANKAIMPACQDVIFQTLKSWHGEPAAGTVVYDEDYIKKHLIVDKRIVVRAENKGHSNQAQTQNNLQNYRGFAQLKFTGPFREESKHRCLQALTRSRLVYTCFISGSILGLLTLLFSYLQLDRATRGFYTSRLQSFFVVALLMLLLFVIWCAKNCQF